MPDNFNVEDDELIEHEASESSEAPEPPKRANASAPKPAPKKASGGTTPRQAAKRKRSEESDSEEVVEPVKTKRPRRAEASSESVPARVTVSDTNGHSLNGSTPEPKRRAAERSRAKPASDESASVTPVTPAAPATPVTPVSKANGTASRALSQSSSDRDLQILFSKLQVICARLGGKPYQNLTLAKLKTLDEVRAILVLRCICTNQCAAQILRND